jgi:hypothetical protein
MKSSSALTLASNSASRADTASGCALLLADHDNELERSNV